MVVERMPVVVEVRERKIAAAMLVVGSMPVVAACRTLAARVVDILAVVGKQAAVADTQIVVADSLADLADSLFVIADKLVQVAGIHAVMPEAAADKPVDSAATQAPVAEAAADRRMVVGLAERSQSAQSVEGSWSNFQS